MSETNDLDSAAGKTVSKHGRRTSGFGQSMTFLCAGSLSFSLLLVAGLLGILGYYGMGYFWPSPLEMFETKSGEVFLAEKQGRRMSRGSMIANSADANAEKKYELYLKVGNRDVYPIDFRWVARVGYRRRVSPRRRRRLRALRPRYFLWPDQGRSARRRGAGRGPRCQPGQAHRADAGEGPPSGKRSSYIEKIEAGDNAYLVNGLQEELQCLEREDLSDAERSAAEERFQGETRCSAEEYARIEARLQQKQRVPSRRRPSRSSSLTDER